MKNTISNVIPNYLGNTKGNVIGPSSYAREKLAFQFGNKLGGVRFLSPYITVNGTTVAASYVYHGGDASAAGWNPAFGGAALTLQAGTAPSYNQGSPFSGGTNDDSVLFNGGGYFLAGNNTFGNIATNDAVWQLGFVATGTTSVLLAKRNAAVGWEIGIDASDRLYLTIEDSGGSVTTVSAALDIGSFYDCEIVADRSGSCQIYANSSTSGAAVDISGTNLTLDSATALAIGADSAGNSQFDSKLMYAFMWSGSSWLDTHLQGTVVSDRYARLTRTYPDFAKGTRLPTTMSRAFSAHLDKLEDDGTTRKMYLAGDNHMRQCVRYDEDGIKRFGHLLEPEATNGFTYSETFDNTASSGAWNNNETTISSNAIASPDKATTADGMVGSVVAGTHSLSRAITHPASNNVISIFAKKGNQNWIALNVSGIACIAYFDLNTGVVGTQTLCTGYIESWGDGWYRCIMSYTGDGAAHTVAVYSAENNNDVNFAGDALTVNTYVWGIQHESGGLGYASSYIPTEGATATRLADQLAYAGGANLGGENAGKGFFAANVLFPPHTHLANRRLLEVSDGKAAADRIGFYVATGSDNIAGYSAATAGNTGATTSAFDLNSGKLCEVGMRFNLNNESVSANGIFDASPDTAVDIPDGLDTIQIGGWQADTQQPACLISNVLIFSMDDIEDPEV